MRWNALLPYAALYCICLFGPVCSARADAEPAAVKPTSEAQTTAESPATSTTASPTSPPATQVQITPLAQDEAIRERLLRILQITGRYDDIQVEVHEGVVFLRGAVRLEEHKAWAGELSRHTQDVVAVINELNVAVPAAWNFQPAAATLAEMRFGALRSLPLVICGFFVLVLAWIAARLATRWMRVALVNRVPAALLREVFARAIGFAVLLVGLYVTLRIANLTHLALTVVGGTGLLGLVVGVSFGNITENFLASILLSMQRPFQVGDLVDVANVSGYVQRLTTRTTVMMTLDGNEVQIPNSLLYKSVIRNYSTSHNRREEFTFTVPEAAPLDRVQQEILDVLLKHPAVLREPEPLVLVDAIVERGVNLRVYFWLNGKEHSGPKVRSSVMRLVMCVIENAAADAAARAAPAAKNGKDQDHPRAAGSSRGTHGKQVSSPGNDSRTKAREPAAKGAPDTLVATPAEGNLAAESEQIKEQAHEARRDDGENLLKTPPPKPAVSPEAAAH